MSPTITQNRGKYGTRSDGPSGPFFAPGACRDESRTDKRCARRVPPPLGPYLVRGSQSGPRLRAPPAGRASALAGDPSPWPAQAALNIRRPGMAAARTAATLFFGGRCGGLLAVVGQAPAPYIVGGGARGGPPAGVGSDAIGSTRCAHWPSQHVSAPAAGGLPLPGIQCPPCPPEGGTAAR